MRHNGVYEALNDVVLSLIPTNAVRILDVGCGDGHLGERLKQLGADEVVGITYSERESDAASRRLSAVHCADLNSFDFSHLGKFDCVILSHVLEHLYDPHAVLVRLKSVLKTDAVVVVALPNVLLWRQRLKFLFGDWRYEDGGILDRTHFRFFDHQSSAELLQVAGYQILQRANDGHCPLLRPVRKFIGGLAVPIDRLTAKTWPGLFAPQFVFLARLENNN
jgi:SAM-dependent methyltransferase